MLLIPLLFQICLFYTYCPVITLSAGKLGPVFLLSVGQWNLKVLLQILKALTNDSITWLKYFITAEAIFETNHDEWESEDSLKT